MNVLLRMCPFVYLFDTSFQNSPYGHVTPLLKPIYYQLRAINLYLEGAAFSVSTIC